MSCDCEKIKNLQGKINQHEKTLIQLIKIIGATNQKLKNIEAVYPNLLNKK